MLNRDRELTSRFPVTRCGWRRHLPRLLRFGLGQSEIENRTSNISSFTLIELLTAIAILGIIMAVLFSSFQSASDATVRNENRIEVNQVVRAVLDLMARDLERTIASTSWITLYQPPGGYLAGSIPTNTLYCLTDLGSGEQNCPGNEGVNIGYRIAQAQVGGLNKWVLQRGDDSLVSPGDYPNNWWTTFNSYPNPPPESYEKCFNTNYWKLLSENVIGVEFTFFTNAAAPYLDYDFTTVWTPSAAGPLPHSIGISLYAIDTDAYNKALRADPSLASAVSRTILTNNVRVYYTRVFLPRSSENP